MHKRHAKIFRVNICDSCAGRQYAQLLSGFTNAERGKFVRKSAALAIESEQIETKDIEPSNFIEFKFRQNKEFAKRVKKARHNKCEVCNGLFDNLDKLAKRVAVKLKKTKFSTFLVGTKPSRNLLDKEEKMWEVVGIDYCEPIRGEINREIGKRLEKLLKKKAELKRPDVTILLDLEKNKIHIKSNSLLIFGYYSKLKRGFPQCKWGTPKKYKTSIEQIIGKPIMKAARGKDHKFHGAGREDIDAICLGKRAFVIEILEPNERQLNLKKLAHQINRGKKVKVFSLKQVDKSIVRRIKAAKPDKTYRILAKLSKSVKPKDLKKLLTLRGTIKQLTPKRVLHRRSDLMRKRAVKSVKIKKKGKRLLELTIKGTAGLYIKELISGDEGRTKPNVADILGVKATPKKLDVLKIDKIKL